MKTLPRSVFSFTSTKKITLISSAGGADERDELCPSMYSFHSSLEEKNQLLFTLTQYGIETTVDRSRKKDRIREWIESSAITEETEEESEGDDLSDKEEMDMRGKHFPEKRESTKGPIREIERQKGSVTKKQKLKQAKPMGFATPKPIERKNPFAPKVAKEREAIAQSASFPNGDPNLGIKLIGADNFALPEVTDFHKSQTESYPASGILDHYEARKNRNNPSGTESPRESPAKIVVSSGKSGPNRSSRSRGPLQEMQSNVKPFTDSTTKIVNKSLANGGTGNGSTPSTMNSFPRRSSVIGNALSPVRDQNEGQILIPDRVAVETSYKPTSPQVPARKHRSQTATLPVLQPTDAGVKSVQPRRSQTTVLPAISNTAPLQPINPLTMSVASQLVMQSFNSLQSMNVALPMVQNEDAVAVTSDVKADRQMVEQHSRNYGKDVYEHYGISQGVVVKVISEGGRHRGSSGSGSRSVSN